MSDELLDPSSTEVLKVAALRRLVTQEPPERARKVLAEAAALPQNAGVLIHIVRAYGLTRDRAAIPEVVPFLAHPRKSVVCNAIKSLVDLDPAEALVHARAVVREAPHEVAFPAALALARSCPDGSRPFFMELTRSERYRDRIASLIYLRSRPPVESVPVLLEMLRREAEGVVREQLNKLLIRRIAKRDARVLIDLRDELVARAAEIDAVLAHLPEQLDPTWRGAGTPPALAAAGDVVRQARARMEQRAVDAQAPASEAVVEPAADARPAEPIEVAEASVRVGVSDPVRASGAQRRPTKKEAPAEGASPAGLGPAIAVAMALVIGVVVMAWPSGSGGPAVAAPPPRASALGNPGESVELSGTVVDVIRAKKTVVLKRGKATTIEAQFLDSDLTEVKPGDTLKITGILRDFRAGEVYRVQGLTFGRG